MTYRVDSFRAQLQIQQMAFVLIAIMIFFALAGVFYVSLRFSLLEESAVVQRDEAARELVRKLAATPEFSWTVYDCAGCVDFDKIMTLKNRTSYRNFWDLDYLVVERVYPHGEDECTSKNYPNCARVTLINTTKDFGATSSAFISLCHWEPSQGGYIRCELGRLYVSGKNIQ